MNRAKGESHRLLIVALYAVAMAWVESAVVYYLRTLVDRIDPHQPNPLPIASGLSEAELIREFATLVMLFSVGWLAGATWRARIGYSALAFGIWDIFYYVFLKVLLDWPDSLFAWDLLFLIPVPWAGPLLAPVMVSIALRATSHVAAWLVWQSMRVSLLEDLPAPAPPHQARRAA